ncbi:DUF3179 domain-containing protein [Halovenus rubra]|uniref:DUF3179 domain-containing protein n=2 Tax=Halovenus rubra TaxID=869890 RepID=A0ACC7DY70_9EURY|nr:DUF3179 domain-containing protein [Halovenus rubra]
MDSSSRRAFLTTATGGMTLLAGCTDVLSGDDSDARDDARHSAENVQENAWTPAAASDESVESADVTGPSDDSESDGTLPLKDPEISVPYELTALEEDAISGGVPKDGIPSIDEPSFDDASLGDENMDDGDPVFGVEIDGIQKAYPQYILVFHEVVNDTFGDRSVGVTYCPLTGSVLGFERGGVELGVSGMLVNSNLIMYDRNTDSWWPQIHPVSPLGERNGLRLREFQVTWTTWGRWKEAYPDTQVLTEDTGRVRNYGSDPYGSYNPPSGYYSDSNTLFAPRHENDEYHPKDVFIGARSGDGAVGFLKDSLRDRRLLETTVDGTPYLAAYHEQLDSAWVYRNDEGVMFDATDDGYEGPDSTIHAADELPLTSVNAFDVLWFSWYGYYPETTIVA